MNKRIKVTIISILLIVLVVFLATNSDEGRSLKAREEQLSAFSRKVDSQYDAAIRKIEELINK